MSLFLRRIVVLLIAREVSIPIFYQVEILLIAKLKFAGVKFIAETFLGSFLQNDLSRFKIIANDRFDLIDVVILFSVYSKPQVPFFSNFIRLDIAEFPNLSERPEIRLKPKKELGLTSKILFTLQTVKLWTHFLKKIEMVVKELFWQCLVVVINQFLVDLFVYVHFQIVLALESIGVEFDPREPLVVLATRKR